MITKSIMLVFYSEDAAASELSCPVPPSHASPGLTKVFCSPGFPVLDVMKNTVSDPRAALSFRRSPGFHESICRVGGSGIQRISSSSRLQLCMLCRFASHIRMDDGFLRETQCTISDMSIRQCCKRALQTEETLRTTKASAERIVTGSKASRPAGGGQKASAAAPELDCAAPSPELECT